MPFVQSATAKALSQPSVSVTLPGVAAGNSILVGLSYYEYDDGVDGLPSGGVSSAPANTWTRPVATPIRPVTAGDAIASIVYAAHGVAGGNTTITISGGAAGFYQVTAAEWSGLANAAADATATDTGAHTSPTSGTTAATTQANAVAFAVFSAGAENAAATNIGIEDPAGYTRLALDNDAWNSMGHAVHHRALSATGAQSAAWGPIDTSGGVVWAGAIAVFKTAAPAGGAVAGSSAVRFAASGTARGLGALRGSAAIGFAASGTARGTGRLSGAAATTFAAGGTARALGALSGSAPVSFQAGGTAGGLGALAGSASIAFAAAGTAQGSQGPSASAAIKFDSGGTARGLAALAGSAAIEFDSGGTLRGTGALRGSAVLAFSAAGTLSPPAAASPISGGAAIRFTAGGTADALAPAAPAPPGRGAQERLAGAARDAARGALGRDLGANTAAMRSAPRGAVAPALARSDLRALAVRIARLERGAAVLAAEFADFGTEG